AVAAPRPLAIRSTCVGQLVAVGLPLVAFLARVHHTVSAVRKTTVGSARAGSLVAVVLAVVALLASVDDAVAAAGSFPAAASRSAVATRSTGADRAPTPSTGRPIRPFLIAASAHREGEN